MPIDFQCTEDEDDALYSFGDLEVRVTGGTLGVPADFDDFAEFERALTGSL